ncbi:hypothetical protein BDW62DRAFT_182256 [Aspergillus aurantiobrunneus]
MVLNHFTAPVLTSTEVPPQPGPGIGNRTTDRASSDPNVPDHRLNINRPCIYERRLPDNAHITAHVQRLQHGYYATDAVSDRDIDNVDFLAVSFVLHSPDTPNHRFKAATIRASLCLPSHSYSQRYSSNRPSRSRSRHHRTNQPRFLMHAPHLLYGSVSPETLQWGYSLTGTLGVAQLPLMASLSPAAGLNGRFNRYEMMRVQGSVRTLHGVPASQIVWTLEENTLQRSGLPREFTFAMLIAKPAPESRVQFVLEIEPVLQSWLGSYPGWWLSLWPRYRPVTRKRGVDFRTSVGQRFGPAGSSSSPTSRRGFNFAALVAGFDEYVSLPGKRDTMTTGGNPQDQTNDPMPLPLPMPNPNPNPNPTPNNITPMPMPDLGRQGRERVRLSVPIPILQGLCTPEQGLWPRQAGRVAFQGANANVDENATATATAQNRSHNSSSTRSSRSSAQRTRSRSSSRRGYYQPR